MDTLQRRSSQDCDSPILTPHYDENKSISICDEIADSHLTSKNLNIRDD